MSDIFICYSRTDTSIAVSLADRLRTNGWSVFLDFQTPIGRRWHREIEKELHTAKAVVALWSAKSCDSDYVLEEAEYGKHKSILFPAFIEQVECPYGFRRIQTADLTGWERNQDPPGLSNLLESLKLHLNVHPILSAPVLVPKEDKPSPTGRPTPPQTFRDKLKIGGEAPLMMPIPAGRFLMGFPKDEPNQQYYEEPLHEVRISDPFALGVYAVTFDDYDRFCDSTFQAKPDDQNWGRGTRPVINVSWEQAQAYCSWLSEQTGRVYKLPSEAEWEYACRAETVTAFYTGLRITLDQANFNGDYTFNGSAKGEYRKQTVPVGTFSPNPFGLYEMHGNVWEWCQDRWHWNYQSSPLDASPWESEGSKERVLRGGCWSSEPGSLRSAKRNRFSAGDRYPTVGFRVTCSSPSLGLRPEILISPQFPSSVEVNHVHAPKTRITE
ncbi:MAG: SUMF1/EgtB/PvdO family nonheme iron enzyme [Acidobacteriota bacterium]